MTVLGAIVRNLEDPQLPLTSTVLAEWLTGTRSDAGVNVGERRVLGLPAYYRACAVTAGTLAGLPIKVYRKNTRERVTTSTVLDSPNPRHTPLEFWFTIYLNAITWGTGYARKLHDGAGIVRQIWPIHPSRVRPEEEDPTPSNPAGLVFLIRDRQGVEQRYTTNEIFHLPYMSADGISGIRPLQLFRTALGIAIAADDAAAHLFKNGGRLQGALSTDQELKPEAAARLKRRWKERTAGPEHTGDIVILDKGAKFAPISLPPLDAQLLQSRQWSVTEMARMVGTPPHIIGDVEKTTSWGTGIEQQVLGWVKFTLGTWIIGSEQRITRELLPGGWANGSWYAKASLEGLLRGDAQSRAAFYHSMIIDGYGNRNEVRDLEDREPVDGLDEFIVPSNMTLISVDGQLVPLAARNPALDTTNPDVNQDEADGNSAS